MSESLGAAAIGEAQCHLAGRAPELRSRQVGEIVEALGAVLELWRDPSSSWRARLEQALPAETGFSKQVVRAGLDLALKDWSAAALRRLVDSELGSFAPYSKAGAGRNPPIAIGFDTTSVLLAGSIPMPTMLALLLPLLLRSPVLAKPSARDRITARLFADSVSSVDERLGRCIEVVPFHSEDADATKCFLRSPCVVAYGSDETIESVAARTDSSQRVVRYGHRLSLAVLGEETTRSPGLPDIARALAIDVALWDQLGCLSPAALYVVDRGAGQAAEVAARLAEALAELGARLPRGDLSAEVRAVIAHERAEAEVRAATRTGAALHSGADLAYSVVLEADATWRGTPLHRFVRVHPVASTQELFAALRPVGARLATVAVAGFGSEQSALAQELAYLGASRVCGPGEMQAPPIDWHHDGMSPLLPLARLADRAV